LKDWSKLLILMTLLLSLPACTNAPNGEKVGATTPNTEDLPLVEVATARTGSLGREPEYVGTTLPLKEATVRVQVAGQLKSLAADVGDQVKRGQPLASVDTNVLMAEVDRAQGELAARQADVTRAQNQSSSAQSHLQEVRIDLQEAQAEANRIQQLEEQGAISLQEAERARRMLKQAEQAFKSAQKQVQIETRALEVAQTRVATQKTLVAQERERISSTTLVAPISGTVMERGSASGSLLRPGDMIFKLGDFSKVKVLAQVSELTLPKIQIGQVVQLNLDAFPSEQLTGTVSRISPTTDPQARLVPVEVMMANPQGKIGSGLLARVRFTKPSAKVIVPLEVVQEKVGASPTVLVVTELSTILVRPVKLGARAEGQVEVLSGLQPGESFVVRSGQPIKEGDRVRVNTSEGTEEQKASSQNLDDAPRVPNRKGERD
jgi:multidrug efflux pump subunit AcrA (membrane-fusion protein)